jgi:peptidoglycan hydrolase-like protein with peptidoglycan-binding domain
MVANAFPRTLVDGSYGPQTAAFVCLVQHTFGLRVDGVAGRETWSALETFDEADVSDAPEGADAPDTDRPAAALATQAGSAAAEASRLPLQRAEGEAEDTSSDAPMTNLTTGSIGPDVAMAQTGLNMRYPGAGITVDGTFGETMLAFVLLFQLDHGLTPDGVIGPETRNRLDPVVVANRTSAAALELSSYLSDLGGADVFEKGLLLPGGALPPSIVRDIAVLKGRNF